MSKKHGRAKVFEQKSKSKQKYYIEENDTVIYQRISKINDVIVDNNYSDINQRLEERREKRKKGKLFKNHKASAKQMNIIATEVFGGMSWKVADAIHSDR